MTVSLNTYRDVASLGANVRFKLDEQAELRSDGRRNIGNIFTRAWDCITRSDAQVASNKAIARDFVQALREQYGDEIANTMSRDLSAQLSKGRPLTGYRMQQVMEKAGAKAMNLSFSEAMPRIASGEVNAVLSSGDGGAGRKLWNYLPCFAEINYAMPISIATMNLDAYNALDAASCEAIDQAAAQTEDAQWTRIEGRLKENYANMRKNGVKIDMRVPASVKEALKSASASSLNDWKAATGADGAALLVRYGKR